MHIAIRASQQQKEELFKKGFNDKIIVDWIDEDENFKPNNIDAYFDLLFDDINLNNNKYFENIPVFVNAINCNCTSINQKNYIRINAWPGFLERSLLELITCNDDYKFMAESILSVLDWNFIWMKDDIGFVSARIISMIINEAYYALEENVSTKEQIDIAMKLGTNYPFGPFEWSEKIGIEKIYNLLQNLALQNERYTICDSLKQAAKDKIEWRLF